MGFKSDLTFNDSALVLIGDNLLQVIHFYWFLFDNQTTSKDERDAGSTASTIAAAAASECSSDVTATVGTRDVIQEVEDNSERSGEMCVGLGEQDIVVVFTTRLLTRLCT